MYDGWDVSVAHTVSLQVRFSSLLDTPRFDCIHSLYVDSMPAMQMPPRNRVPPRGRSISRHAVGQWQL